jgi:hypothetical protein
LLKALLILRAITLAFPRRHPGSRRLTSWYKLNRVSRIGNQNAGPHGHARRQHTSKPPGAIMDPRLFEDLLRAIPAYPPDAA